MPADCMAAPRRCSALASTGAPANAQDDAAGPSSCAALFRRSARGGPRLSSRPGDVLPANTTVVPRTAADAGRADTSQVNLIALLTADGQQIDQGLVWRIYE